MPWGQEQTPQAEYELREAREEIRRHHELIVELRDGLRWALDMMDAAIIGRWSDDLIEQHEQLGRLLDRKVG